MKLKFYGMNDEGKPTDSGVEKYFPMKIIQCDFNITGGGTEYNFEAVPYNANTLEDNRAKITQPVNLAGATVGEQIAVMASNGQRPRGSALRRCRVPAADGR